MADGLAAFRQRLSQPVTRIGLALAGGILALDQLTKYLVLDRLNFSPPGCLDFQRAEPAERAVMANTCGHIELSPVFDLTMVWNKGVSFGLFGADTWVGRLVLITFSLAVAAGLLAGLFQTGPLKALRPLQGAAFGFIIGGAVGNAIDRGLYGAVVDFLNFSDIHFPYVFNIADVGINLGVAAIILDMLLSDRKSESTR
ncbi:signal peptidase II [Maricaulis parjimensis]|uniref:signal peptidase II n=1 Tax=Maricaulis parjimensis TaxID=144023 RepID=UPI001939E9D5|nr:signal peptidase II [Maricaulis parjimensis]